MPNGPTSCTALSAYPGLGSAALQTHEHVTIGYVIEGSDAARIENFVQTVYAAQRSRKNFSPVFITSCAAFDVFFGNNYIFEYLPPKEDFAAEIGTYEAWRQARIDHISKKWCISDFIAYDSESATRVPVDRRGRRCVVVYPDYGNGNPYIDMMYAKMIDDFDISFGDPQKAARMTGFGSVTFHLHWEDAVMRNLRDDATPAAMATFVVAIDELKARGGSFIWTIHNLEPHDTGDRQLSREFSRQLFLRADKVHVHDRHTADALIERYEIEKHINVIEHPSYKDRYPQKLDRSLARQSLGLDADDQLFLCFGQLRRYKGVANLMNVAPEFISRAKFIIAGRSGQYDPRLAPPENCISFDGHIDDEMVTALFSAADFAVLPFEQVTSSGSLLLALSFDVPVITPAHDSVAEIIRDGCEGYLYAPGAGGAALSQAIQRALDTPAWRRDAMEQSAAAAAAFRSPEAFALAVRQMFEDKVSGTEISEMTARTQNGAPSAVAKAKHTNTRGRPTKKAPDRNTAEPLTPGARRRTGG